MNIDPGRLGLGCAPLGGLYRGVTDAEAVDTVEEALAHGVSFFDTAPAYGDGASERRLGLGLRGTTGAQVCTKVGHVVGHDGDTRWGTSAADIRRSLELSLERLQLDRVDVALLHDPQSAPGELPEVIDVGLEALAALRAEGLVGRIGIGTAHLEAHELALGTGLIDVAMVSGRAYLLDRSAVETLLPRLENAGVGVLNVAVLGTGLLAQPWPGDDAKWGYAPAPAAVLGLARELARVATEAGVELPAAALRFADGQPAVERVVVGAVGRAHVAELVRRFRTPIGGEVLERLARVALQSEGVLT